MEPWLGDWGIASKSTALLFAMAARSVRQPRLVKFFEGLIEWIEIAPSFGVTLDTLLILSAQVCKMREREAQTLGVIGPLLNRRRGLTIRKVC
jgi:hypothetical protein